MSSLRLPRVHSFEIGELGVFHPRNVHGTAPFNHASSRQTRDELARKRRALLAPDLASNSGLEQNMQLMLPHPLKASAAKGDPGTHPLSHNADVMHPAQIN